MLFIPYNVFRYEMGLDSSWAFFSYKMASAASGHFTPIGAADAADAMTNALPLLIAVNLL